MPRSIEDLDETRNTQPEEGCQFCAFTDDEMPDCCFDCKHWEGDQDV